MPPILVRERTLPTVARMVAIFPRSLPAASYSLDKTYSPAESRSTATPVLVSNNDKHHDVDDDDDDEDGCCCCCCCGCDGGGGGGGGDSNNEPPRLKNTRVLAHSRPDDTMSRCCGTKIGAAGPHGVFRAARLTSRNPPHTTIDPNGGRTDVRTDEQAGKQARRITGEAAGAGTAEDVRGGQRPRGEGNGPPRGGRLDEDESGAAAARREGERDHSARRDA
ncbi:hypothetical protein ALC60_01501 [Trachymyrmex zeteki]|uniref:Uncharacterized protein n=1 Tax=Mycetomoellerius zeteki TaxID=64791 RepID=A0A151XGJ4_9HYME|nr:hypothetical protein ALC60_01501 [Trachymyrmex zeteki]